MKITSFDVYRKRHRFVGQIVVPLRDHLRVGADELFDRKPIWRDFAAEELKCAAVGENLKVNIHLLFLLLFLSKISIFIRQ